MSEHERFGDLRSLLHQPGTPERWELLCLLLDACSPHQARHTVFPYVSRALEQWPDAVRVAPQRWVRALHRTPAPLWLPLARSLDLQTAHHDDPGARHELLDALMRHPHVHDVRALRVRGVMDAAQLSQLLEWSALARAHTLSVSKTELGDELAAIIASQQELPALRHLLLPQNAIGPQGLGALARSPHLAHLETLRLEHNRPGAMGAEAMLELRCLESLRDFGLGGKPQGGDGLGWQGVQVLHEGGCFEQLRVLNLMGNQIGHAHAEVRALCPLASEVDLSSNSLTEQGLERLLGALNLDAISGLRLGANRLTGASAQALAQAPWAQLRQLDLHGNALGAQGACALLGSMSGLKSLDLSGTSIQEGGLVGLEEWGALEQLSLSYTSVGDDDLYGMTRAEALSGLRHLDVRATRVGERGGRMLATSPYLEQLSWLDLSETRVGDAGVAALARAPLRALRALVLERCALTDEGARALASAPWLPGLRELSLRGNAISERGLRALHEAAGMPEPLREQFKPVL